MFGRLGEDGREVDIYKTEYSRRNKDHYNIGHQTQATQFILEATYLEITKKNLDFVACSSI